MTTTENTTATENGNDKKPAVRLYAGPTTAEATAWTEGYRFSRITAAYTLIYTEKPAPNGFIELDESEAHRITAADRQWLTDCQTALVVEHVQREKPKIVSRLNDLIELAEALERKKREEGDTHGGNSDN